MGSDQGERIGRLGSEEGRTAPGPPARHPRVQTIGAARAWVLWSAVTILAAALLGAAASQGSMSRHGTKSPASTPPLPALLPPINGRRPTFVLFQNGTSSIERQFLAGLRRDGPARDDLRVVLLNSLDSPTARRFVIRETPTLLALEPGGHEISRRVGPQEITAALAATAPGNPGPAGAHGTPSACRVWRGPRLRWVEENDPRARRVYRRFGGGRWGVPEVFKAMSLRPDLMEKALDLSEIGHFSDGYLDRRTKERIATYVSYLNGSHYCLGSHAGGLRDLGVRSAEVAALAGGDLDAAALSPKDRALFEYIRLLTLKPGDVRDEDVARLRRKGWRDEQIFEAAFDAALFAYFNRLAITYGLDYPPEGWQPSPHPLRTARRSAS